MPIGRLDEIVIDCLDPIALSGQAAAYYNAGITASVQQWSGVAPTAPCWAGCSLITRRMLAGTVRARKSITAH